MVAWQFLTIEDICTPMLYLCMTLSTTKNLCCLHHFPSIPGKRLHRSNLFVFKGKHCVNIYPAPSGAVLIFTHYLEVIQLNATTSAIVILTGSSSSPDMEVHILW